MSESSSLVTLCQQRGSLVACWNNAGVRQTIIVSPSYDTKGLPVVAGTQGTDGATDIGLVYSDVSGAILSGVDPADVTLGACQFRHSLDTCFLPDQYAIQWAWNGGAHLQSYDPLTGDWTYHGQTAIGGTNIGGFALAFKNDLVEPTLFFQVNGQLYRASPDDPIGSFSLVGSTAPATSSYPCFDFDPSGRLLIGDGKKVWSINPDTGASVFLGNLIDARDGANLNVAPGDWFFDPNGGWFMMARDTRGAMFGEPCTNTVLWKIDTATLEAVRVSPSCAPTSGTGATWLAAGRYLLSVSGGAIYEYNSYTDTWSIFENAPQGVNDLAAQWIIPDPIRVMGYIEFNEQTGDCEPKLYTLDVDEDTLETVCSEFTTNLAGQFGSCEPSPNPFVSDPFSPSGGEAGCETCPDQVWLEGCSDVGYTKYRTYYDAAGNSLTEYLYGSLTSPVASPPPNFTQIPCATTLPSDVTVTVFCDTDTGQSVYRREEGDAVTWFDASGTIPEPPNKDAGECPNIDPNILSSDEIICLDGEPSVRRVIETYAPNADGLPELVSTQVIYFNGSGTLWDSLAPFGSEPEDWYVGQCTEAYIDYRFEKLCEENDRKLLLIDSGGSFAEYSFFDSSLTPISIPVPSAGSGADVENYLLYAITQGDDLLTIDVNTRTQLSSVPLSTMDGSPLVFSAASFYNGFLYAADSGVGGWRLYRINPATAEVSFFQGPYTGIAGTGASLAINPVDGKFYINGSSGRVYEVDPTGASLAATLVYNSPGNIANGATFDTSGNLYLTGGTNTYQVLNFPSGPEITLIDDWAPAANSIAYYEILAQQPACFFRKYGVTQTGDIEYLSDHYVADGSERIVAGAVTCCECSEGCNSAAGVGGDSGSSAMRTAVFSSQRFAGAVVAPTIPADTYEISVYNGSNDNPIEVTIGADSQVVLAGTSHKFTRDPETEAPFSGATALTVLGGGINSNDEFVFNYKSIS